MSELPFLPVDRRAQAARKAQRAARQGQPTSRPAVPPPTVPAMLVEAPDARSTEWHDSFVSSVAAFGSIRAACKLTSTSRQLVEDHKAKYPAFAAAIASAELDFRDWVFEQGMQRIKGGSDSMIQFYLRALDPRFRDKRTIEYTMTDRDRKEIEKQAREHGLDPAKVLADVERRQARRGNLKVVS